MISLHHPSGMNSSWAQEDGHSHQISLIPCSQVGATDRKGAGVGSKKKEKKRKGDRTTESSSEGCYALPYQCSLPFWVA